VQTLLAQRTGARVHWNQGGREDAEVERVVRDLWGRELTAESATQIALLNNPRLQAKYESLGVAQADLVQAGLLRNPVLSGALHFPIQGTVAGTQSGGVTGWDVNLLAEFIDLFMLPLRKRYASAELERVKLEVADSILDTAAQVKVAFYTAQAEQ